MNMPLRTITPPSKLTPPASPATPGRGRLLLTVEPTGCNVEELPDIYGVVNYLTGDNEMHDGALFIAGNGKTFDFPCPADLDGSGWVDFADVIEIIAQWGDEVPCLPDLSRNGIVDFEDIMVVLGEWGFCLGE